jgi:hypothetical protein
MRVPLTNALVKANRWYFVWKEAIPGRDRMARLVKLADLEDNIDAGHCATDRFESEHSQKT